MGRQLSSQQLLRLEKHSYSSTTNSLLDPYMQSFWCWLVNRCPVWLAPNLITITGLIINIVTCLILMYYSPDARQEVPRWSSLLCALGIFIYQSLDAIDGKQARRIGTSSPLGELFDHGCDSLSNVFVSLSVCCAVQLGHHPQWMLFQCLTAYSLFYCSHWQTYVSGTLKFNHVDVTEAQFVVMIILGISGTLGSNFWAVEVPILGLPLMCVPTLVGTLTGAMALFNNFKVILFERGAGRNGSTVAIPYLLKSLVSVLCSCLLFIEVLMLRTFLPSILYNGAGKNGSTVAGTSVISPVMPLLLIICPAVVVALKSSHGIYVDNGTLYLLAFGFVSARVTNRLVVAQMTKSEMSYTDSGMLGPATLFLNQYFNCPISEYTLLILVLVYVTYDLIKYCSDVCLDICDHLNICLFLVTPDSSAVDKNGSPNKYNTRSKGRLRS